MKKYETFYFTCKNNDNEYEIIFNDQEKDEKIILETSDINVANFIVERLNWLVDDYSISPYEFLNEENKLDHNKVMITMCNIVFDCHRKKVEHNED